MLTLLLALLPHAAAATLPVCGESPTQGCFATVQDAVDAATDGDVVALPAGTFGQSVTIDGVDLSLVGDSRQSTQLLGDYTPGQAVVTIRGATVTLSNLAIASSAQQPLWVGTSDVTVTDSVLIGGGVQAAGGVIAAHASTVAMADTDLVDGKAVIGGLVFLNDSTFGALRSGFRNGRSLTDGGGFYLQGASQLGLGTTTYVLDNTADGAGGGIFVAEDATGVEVALVGTRLTGNVAGSTGGAGDLGPAHLTATQAVFLANRSGGGGALRLPGSADIEASKFCQNGSDGDGGAILADAAGDLVIANSWFLENEGDVTGALGLGGAGGHVSLRFNHIAYNRSEGGRALMLPSNASSVEVTAQLVAFNTGERQPPDPAIDIGRGASALGQLARSNLVWGNASARLIDLLKEEADTVVDDPKLRGVGAGECEGIPGGLNAGSAARDAGPPDVLDPDGTRSDIGAAGGDGGLLTWWLDRDQDAFPAIYDCDDGDAAVNPDATDIAYDGEDTNCDSWNDFDKDRDGFISIDWDGDDCDDDDDTRYPGAFDDSIDDIDQDCDGFIENDSDGDGYIAVAQGGSDCNDYDPTVHPGAADTDPDRDVDCDGVMDLEEPVEPGSQCSTLPVGALAWGWFAAPFCLIRRRA